MIACAFSHNCSLSIERDSFRIVGQDGIGRLVNDSGRWMHGYHGEAVAAVQLRENLAHVITDGGHVYEFDATGGRLTIRRLH